MTTPSHNTSIVSEEELRTLASSVGPPDVNLVAHVLGMKRQQIDKIRQDCGHNAEESSFRILKWWRQRHHLETDPRGKLVNTLNEIGRTDLCQLLKLQGRYQSWECEIYLEICMHTWVIGCPTKSHTFDLR